MPLVLKGLTFEVKDGEHIGICGRTGSGKSTLIMSILRVIEGFSGSISINGHDISQVPLKLLRQRITLIAQESVLFEDTLRTNLDPLNSCEDKKLWEVLEKVHLL